MAQLRLNLVIVLIISLVFLAFQLTGFHEKLIEVKSNANIDVASLFNRPVVGSPSLFKIPSLDVNANITSVGLTSDGAIGAPDNPNDVGWFTLGPKPGEKGTSIIVGHYGEWKDGSSSIFDDLHKLNPGDKVYVKDSNGKTITFSVKETRIYDKDDPSNEVFKQSRTATLNIITCNGDWISAEKTYTKRLVVFTELVN